MRKRQSASLPTQNSLCKAYERILRGFKTEAGGHVVEVD